MMHSTASTKRRWRAGMAMRQRTSSTTRGSDQRTRSICFAAIPLVATLVMTAAGPVAATATANPTTQVSSAVGAVSLSMSVKPGQPVPLLIVTEKSKGSFAKKGFTGQGIDVALIDSGVTMVKGLDQAGKILYGPDLSNEGGLPNLANLDTYGHGTHMAGIIVGDDGADVVGVAPGSRLISIKVAGATGETNIAQVIAGIDWVVDHKNDPGINIRVLNLSLGMGGLKSAAADPLAAAVERAWKAGIVVVVSAGNRGNNSSLDSPATDPYVIAVGAIESYDSKGGQDSMSSWSSGGDAIRQPDVVAAGRSLVSFRVPGSMLDQQNPKAIVGTNYFRGSGTSQSAAVVSGFVAVLLSVQPSLTPDQVKYLLTSTAIDVAKRSTVDGAGKIDPSEMAKQLKNAVKAPIQSFAALTVVVPVGPTWTGGTWSGASWSGGTWSGASWSGASWSGASWSGASWSGASWSGASWSGASWSGATWSGAAWCGASWLAQDWT